MPQIQVREVSIGVSVTSIGPKLEEVRSKLRILHLEGNVDEKVYDVLMEISESVLMLTKAVGQIGASGLLAVFDDKGLPGLDDTGMLTVGTPGPIGKGR